MAPIPSRQLLAWTLPTIAALLSYLWYKRKRIGVLSDPGVHAHKEENQSDTIVSLEEELEQTKSKVEPESTPSKTICRSLSGVESTPIDIVLPPQLRASRSASKVISDEELDFEIEKIKSMKSGNLFSTSKIEDSPQRGSPERKSPQEEQAEEKPVVQTPSPPKKEREEVTPLKLQTSNNKKQKNKMVRKDVEMVNDQLTSLDISNNRSSPHKPEDEHEESSNGHKSDLDIQRQSNERDSANHSPADVMLASPSLSIISDNHSEVRIQYLFGLFE